MWYFVYKGSWEAHRQLTLALQLDHTVSTFLMNVTSLFFLPLPLMLPFQNPAHATFPSFSRGSPTLHAQRRDLEMDNCGVLQQLIMIRTANGEHVPFKVKDAIVEESACVTLSSP